MKIKLSSADSLGLKISLALGVWLLMVAGCQTQEPPLSPGAAAFKKEVQQAIGMMAKELADPVAKSDKTAVAAVLDKIMPASLKLCRACPFMLGVLDPNGVILAVHPPKKEYSGNYSDYKLVMKALEDGEVCQGQLFLQDGSKLYTICSPLMKERKALGIVVLTTTDNEVKQRWGISDAEFAAINFNK